MIRLRFLLAATMAVAALCSNPILEAAFPGYLVIGQQVVKGSPAGEENGTQLFKYEASGGVLVLFGDCGGNAGWGSDLSAAKQSVTGSWNGSLSVSVSGKSVTVPRIVLSGSSTSYAPDIVGLDGVVAPKLATGIIDDRLIVVYRSLSDGTDIPDGFLFYFNSGGSNFYRYTAGPSAFSVTNAPTWTASNIFGFPAQLEFPGTLLGGEVLDLTSMQQGLADCYWATAYYTNSRGLTGELHAYVGRNDGSQVVQVWGYAGAEGVSGIWEPQNGFSVDSQIKPKKAGFGPSFGPLKILWGDAVLPYSYSDAEGSDVYFVEGKRVVIDWQGQFTMISSDRVKSGSYANNSFHGDPYWTFEEWNSGFLLAVKDDGSDVLGDQVIATVLTSDDNYPGDIRLNADSVPVVGKMLLTDGTTRAWYYGELYQQGIWPCGYSIGTSPAYAAPSGRTRVQYDLRNHAWPAGCFSGMQFPSVIYLAGRPAPGYAAEDRGVLYWSYAGDGASYYGYRTADGLQEFWAYLDDYSDYAMQNVAPDKTIFEFYSFPLTFDPGLMHMGFGPARITWMGRDVSFRGGGAIGGEMFDNYQSDDGVISIAVSMPEMRIRAPFEATFSCTPEAILPPESLASQFADFALQDNFGNLLNTAPGVILHFGTSCGGENIALSNGLVRSRATNVVYRYRMSDGTWGVKFEGLPGGSLFLATGPDAAFSSPILRTPINGADFEALSGTVWNQAGVYPDGFYVNGHYAARDDTTKGESGSGLIRSGSVKYRILNLRSGYVALKWTWDSNGFHGGIGGSIPSAPVISGSWNGSTEGNSAFTNVTSSVRISFTPETVGAKFGPPSIQWNGVTLVYDPIASTATVDVYHDLLGLGLGIQINSNGDVTLRLASGPVTTPTGSTLVGHFTSNGNRFTFPYGSGAGQVLAVTSAGTVIQTPSDTREAVLGELTEIPGDLDVFGSSFTLGTWTSASNYAMSGFSLSFTSGIGDQPSAIEFSSSRKKVDWVWSHSDPDGAETKKPTAKIDASGRLLLYNSQGTPTIILDPNGHSRIEPQGDIGMGTFKTEASQ